MRPIAMGKIAANGNIFKATPGITITKNIIPGNIYGGADNGYVVNLPDRLVCDSNYIIQLTVENYAEDGPDHVITSIAARNQRQNSFEVLIWADRIQTIQNNQHSYTIETVSSNWHFVIYDINNCSRCD